MILEKLHFPFKYCFLFFVLMLMVSCFQTKEEKQVQLYNTHCASCHMLPAIDALPKALWKEKVLPEMAARMGIRDATNDPYKDISMQEQAAIIKTGIYPSSPIIDVKDWELLEEYILHSAPEKLSNSLPKKKLDTISQFSTIKIALDSTNGSTISYLKYDREDHRILAGSIRGELLQYDIETKLSAPLLRAGSTITDFSIKNNNTYLTTIGFLLPSEIASGALGIKEGEIVKSIPQNLHRPVHTLIHDFDKDGNDEIVISEFGDLKGQLALWTKDVNGNYVEKVLLNRPGVIRVIAKDMNADGIEDMVVISSQGDEAVSILYQKEDLKFIENRVLRFPPIYGSSWFELIDYDNDGDDDIITVNGDNADETYLMKPYHGMRIHLNDGENNFEEAFFYPMNGCTRVIANDFDQDGDYDMALISTFPDYKDHPDATFLYLENKDSENLDFKGHALPDPNVGRWFLMDTGDIDSDGDEDLILSSLTYEYSPIPDNLKERWNQENTDILLLENQLN